MARKPIVIELDRCPMLESSLIEVAHRLDHCGKIEGGRGNTLVGLKTNMKKLITDGIKLYEEAHMQLFGELRYEDEDIQNISYLRGLIR